MQHNVLKKLIPAILLSIIIVTVFIFTSCSDKGAIESTKTFAFTSPEGASLIIKDVRIKGFTIEWTQIDKSNVEYAVAASYKGGIDTYEDAKSNGYVVLNFTKASILEGTYKITQLMPGKEYAVKLFAREKNTKAAEYLSGKQTLHYIDEAGFINVSINDSEAMFNNSTDTYNYIYIPGNDDKEYKVTYKLINSCELFIGDKKTEEKEITIIPDLPLDVTVINKKNGAARDYTISLSQLDNGLPVVVIETENKRKLYNKDEYTAATMQIKDSKDNPSGIGLYNGEIQIKGRGNSSLGMPKKGMNVELPLEVQLLDMAPSKDWMLLANYSDKTLIRNFTAYELYRDMGAIFSPKLRFVDLIVNGEYLGTYNLGERVKLDKGKLDLPKIKAGNNTDPAVIDGSYVIEVNSTDKYSKDEVIFETKRINWKKDHFFSIKQPGEKNISDVAIQYISDYVNKAEDALFADNFSDPVSGYRQYIDEVTVIDWYIVNELYKQVDAGFHTSVYFYKPRGGKLSMGPVWDFDLGGGNADYAGCDDPAGWYVRNSEWMSRFFEDEQFVADFKARWNYVKEHYFEGLFNRIDETAEYIDKSQQMNFAKWQILGVYVWPNAGDVSSRNTYQSEIDYLKDWLQKRIDWMDGEINK